MRAAFRLLIISVDEDLLDGSFEVFSYLESQLQRRIIFLVFYCD